MRMIKAIQIDPFACTVKEVEYDASDYKNIYPLLSHETMPVDCFTMVHFDDGDGLFVDDEGLLKQPDRFFQIDGYEQPLAGKGLMIGSDDEGDSVSVKMKVSDIKVKFFMRLGKTLVQIDQFLGAK